jgi:hypothetical protein
MTINGQSGTILEIYNGNILCDFREFIAKYFNGICPKKCVDFHCMLAEINIIFKFD